MRNYNIENILFKIFCRKSYIQFIRENCLLFFLPLSENYYYDLKQKMMQKSGSPYLLAIILIITYTIQE